MAINGAKAKGSDFIDEAIKRGAVCVVAGHPVRQAGLARPTFRGVPLIPFADTRYALAILADEFFGHPSGKLKVVGVTGTNGKTTITYLIRSILSQAGFSSGIIGTINYCFKDKIMPAPNTTPGPLDLQLLLKTMVDAGCGYCVMEVSSHGLQQNRTEGIEFAAAIFTNLTPEHLDYHLNLDNYFLAKSRLFSGLSKEAYAIINLDSPFALRLLGLSRGKFVGYAVGSQADVRATNLVLGLWGSEFILKTGALKTKIKTRLIGKHNVSNILAAIAFALTQGIELADIKKALGCFEGVKGRLQKVRAGNRNIFIDYAHTPDALENVLGILRQFSKNNLLVVFGCGGERDSLKRPLMGKVAEKYADVIILTSDNPRGEDPEEIARDIASGIKSKDYKIILERREAIRYALSKSKEQDTVIIAGKGHENYQIFKTRRIEFDDNVVTQDYIREKGWEE